MKKASIIFICFVVCSSVYAGGGWTKPKKKGYYKVSEWWITSTQHYTTTGGIDPNVTNVLASSAFYGEYGITDRLTTMLYFPFFCHTHFNKQVSQVTGQVIPGGSEGDQYNGIGDADLSFKYGITRSSRKVVAAVSVLLGLPIGNVSAGRTGALQTGDGEFNQMLRVDASTSFSLFKNVSGYGNVYVGANNRTNNFSDEFRSGAEIGLTYKNKIWYILRVDDLRSFKNSTLTSEQISSVFGNNMEFTSFTNEVAYYLTKKVGISASIGTAVRGLQIAANPTYSVGVFLDVN